LDSPLKLLDFTGFGMKPLAELVGDGNAEGSFISDASQYGRTQQWAAWFRSTHPDAAGFSLDVRGNITQATATFFFDDICRYAQHYGRKK